jgi:alpha-tubulin suppressor-like RCC1 family protein
MGLYVFDTRRLSRVMPFGMMVLSLAISGCIQQTGASKSKLLTETSRASANDVTAPLSVANNVAPSNDVGVSKVVSSVQHACAIRGGALSCWGLNKHGQIGNGESGVIEGQKDPITGTDYTARVVLRPFLSIADGVTDVAVGYEHTCAIRAGELLCWGSNEYGQLGLGSSEPKIASNPTTVLSGVRQVAARGRWTCAVTEAGKLVCFGTRLAKSANGPAPLLVARSPKEIASGATSVSMSATHACTTIEREGASSVVCFGSNDMGEIGNGTVEGDDVALPYESIASGASVVALGANRSCAIVDGKMKCFGMSLGDRAIDEKAGGWRVPNGSPYDATFWSAIAPGLQISASGAVLSTAGDLYYGSYFHAGGAPQKVAVGARDFAFAENDENGCVMFRNRAVKCWGSNLFGQLGIGRRSGDVFLLFKAQDVVF